MKTLKSKPFLSFFTVFLVLISLFLFSNKSNQSISWTFPYFSGAANFSGLFEWQISLSDFEQVKNLSPEEYREYKHQSTSDLVPYSVNNYGYVLIALTSLKLFPSLGDLQGVILLQSFVHLAVVLFVILFVLETPMQRFGFIFLYAANPLIVHYVTYPFYYFWLFLPSLAFVVLLLKPSWRPWTIPLSVPALLFSLLIRPTTLFLVVFFFMIAFHLSHTSIERWRSALSGVAFILGFGFILSLSSSSPWHQFYIGLGAYENNFGLNDLSDHQGFAYYHSTTGVKIDTHPTLGNWNDQSVRQAYMDSLKDRYFNILWQYPRTVARNAIMNILQVFSVGYIVNHPVLTWVSAVLGFFMLIFLIYTQQIVWVFGIFSSALGFVLYFPPIPAYNFAAYFLLVVSGLLGLETLFNSRTKY